MASCRAARPAAEIAQVSTFHRRRPLLPIGERTAKGSAFFFVKSGSQEATARIKNLRPLGGIRLAAYMKLVFDGDMPSRSTRGLRFAVAAGGLVPVGAGLAGILLGPEMAQGAFGGLADAVSLDSHFRYLSGLLLGIGLGFWSPIPGIERHGAAFRLLTAIVVAGGLGRAVALWLHGMPSAPMLFGLAMELGVTPLLCLWQVRLAVSEPQSG